MLNYSIDREVSRLFDAVKLSVFVNDIKPSLHIYHAGGGYGVVTLYNSSKIHIRESIKNPDEVYYALLNMYERLDHFSMHFPGGGGTWYFPREKDDRNEEWIGFFESLRSFREIFHQSAFGKWLYCDDFKVYYPSGVREPFNQFYTEIEKKYYTACKAKREYLLKKIRDCRDRFDLENRKFPFGRMVCELYTAIKVIFKNVNDENIANYGRLCAGTLKRNKFTKELAEAKIATERIINYLPELSNLIDLFDKADGLMADIYEKWPDIDNSFSMPKRFYGNHTQNQFLRLCRETFDENTRPF